MKHMLLKFIAFAACATLSIHAHAYTTWECLGQKEKWAAETTTMRLGNVSFAPGAWRDAMTTAINRWNQNPSEFRFGVSYNDASVSLDNGQSEAWFSDDAGLLDGAPAVTFIQWDCIDYWIFGTDVEITEADIVFDVAESYTTSTSKSNLWGYGGSYRPFQTTAMHELGHALGLAHTNNTYNMMGQDWTHTHANGSTTRAYSGEDANNGAVYLYGSYTGTLEDLAVTHWKYSGASGEYSTHVRTRVLDSAGNPLPSYNDAGELRYYVSRGQTVRLELTYENNGKTTTTVPVGYYVSTNDFISTGDTWLGDGSVSLGRNTVFTTSNTYLAIPSSLNYGQKYWLGAVIDRNGAVGEITESNNATYVPIQVNPIRWFPFPLPVDGILSR